MIKNNLFYDPKRLNLYSSPYPNSFTYFLCGQAYCNPVKNIAYFPAWHTHVSEYLRILYWLTDVYWERRSFSKMQQH